MDHGGTAEPLNPSPSMPKRPAKSPPVRATALDGLFRELAARILGQDEVLDRLSRAVLRLELGGVPPGGCARCFLFAGPTGVGKTETAQNLSELVFGPGHFVRFDCAEFKTLDRVTELLGNRSGDAGRFEQAFRQSSRGVWLFDEIEKAHPEFVHLFLAMTEANRVTLANGDTLDLSDLYIIVTSNLGSAEILGREHLPFVSLEKRVVRSIERHFRPELLRRFGHPFVFRPLNRATQEAIVALHLRRFLDWHASKGRTITAGPEVVRFLVAVGFSHRLGAGPLLAAIHQYAGDAITENLLNGGTTNGRLIVDENRLRLAP
jgi:ATP-dependent Clp protease ATP-binding subunit ClpA